MSKYEPEEGNDMDIQEEVNHLVEGRDVVHDATVDFFREQEWIIEQAQTLVIDQSCTVTDSIDLLRIAQRSSFAKADALDLFERLDD